MSQAIHSRTVIVVLLAGAACAAQAVARDLSDCGLNHQSRALASLIISDSRQRRERVVCNRLLARVADHKAREMAQQGRVAHLGAFTGANVRLVEAGYPLADIYPRLLENNVEAIAGGLSGAEDVWHEFLVSPAHRMHLLGEHQFYLLQDELGVGYHADRNSPHVEYWVVYLAHRDNDREYHGPVARSKH